MKFGVFLNQYYTEDGEFEVTDLFEQADVIEERGFDSIEVGERHVHEEGFAEAITTLAALAERTDTVELATTAVLPALYNPLHLAEQLAMIDRISGGRVTFGAALGYREDELEPFGVTMDDRVSMMLESMHLLKRFWSEDSVTHDGGNWSFDGAFVSPRPDGDIPVWVGGHADIAIKRAAYRGSGWIASASSTAEDLVKQIGVYEDALDEFDKDRSENDVILMRDCYVADSMEEAREAIEPYLLNLYQLYARWGQTYLDEHEVEVDYDELEEKFVIGTPEQCIEQLRTYEELGVDHVVLRCQFPGQPQESAVRCLERLGDDILPAFK
ncbi:LLM class flavin-dependent oxidoreductase [Halosolutus gelatinilyticus]|uniref:LLM class flavin-dependent oxidoreductase n=1 Tax=Halosolutus gelatinilyticus TaxID=2931975 RepID=UPI001FF60C33|nr:LLM class flavin-dependent oxidoreductase [Halosolutus gelatinilyticus]